MAKSIMHQKDGSCYLCMQRNDDYDCHKITEEHHAVFGTANRRLAEHYGLKVYLCKEHHTDGKFSVHKNYKVARRLQQDAQKVFEAKYPNLSFRKIFGINYKTEDEPVATSQKEEPKEPGFRFIEREDE